MVRLYRIGAPFGKCLWIAFRCFGLLGALNLNVLMIASASALVERSREALQGGDHTPRLQQKTLTLEILHPKSASMKLGELKTMLL